MKPRTQIMLVAALLIALVAWSEARRGSRSDSAGQSCGTCYPFLPSSNATLLPSRTNETTIKDNVAMPSVTNLTPSSKQQ